MGSATVHESIENRTNCNVLKRTSPRWVLKHLLIVIISIAFGRFIWFFSFLQLKNSQWRIAVSSFFCQKKKLCHHLHLFYPVLEFELSAYRKKKILNYLTYCILPCIRILPFFPIIRSVLMWTNRKSSCKANTSPHTSIFL